MAEAFGVAAGAFSVLTLLEHIIKSIEKLKSLRSFIKTIPHELQGLIDDIELVQGVLKTTSPNMLQISDIPSIERRLRAFQTDLEALISNIQKYQLSATGRRMGAIKLFMKREDILAQRRNLENIRNTLGTLQWTYCCVTLREFVPIIRMQNIRTERAGMMPYEETVGNDDRQVSMHQRDHKPKNAESQVTTKSGWKVRFRTPLVVIDKIWALQAKRCYSDWTFNFRTYNVVPRSSPIVLACMTGDITKVQRLFSAGLASVYDCSDTGGSLLHHAAYNRRLETCQFLLANGADPDHANNWKLCPIHALNFRGHDLITNVPLAVELYRLLINASVNSIDPFEDLGTQYTSFSAGFQGPPEALVMMQQYTFADYASLPLHIRFNRTMALNSLSATPSVLEIAMGGKIEAAAYHLENEFGDTLFHKLASCMGSALSREEKDATHKWRPLLKDAIAASADPNKMTDNDYIEDPPLSTFITFFVWNWKAIRRSRYDLNPALRIWASELKLAGVDLEVYGANVSAFVQECPLSYRIYVGPLRFRSTGYIYDDKDLFGFCFWKITYGPKPEDWQVWVTNPIDELVGGFWEMVEREEAVMPGTWVE